MKFSQLKRDAQESLIEFVMRQHAVTRTRAVEELDVLDEIDLAYVKVEMKLAQSSENGYDPYRDFYKLG